MCVFCKYISVFFVVFREVLSFVEFGLNFFLMIFFSVVGLVVIFKVSVNVLNVIIAEVVEAVGKVI